MKSGADDNVVARLETIENDDDDFGNFNAQEGFELPKKDSMQFASSEDGQETQDVQDTNQEADPVALKPEVKEEDDKPFTQNDLLEGFMADFGAKPRDKTKSFKEDELGRQVSNPEDAKSGREEGDPFSILNFQSNTSIGQPDGNESN